MVWSLVLLAWRRERNVPHLIQIQVTDAWLPVAHLPAWPLSVLGGRVGIRTLPRKLGVTGWRHSGTVRWHCAETGTNQTQKGWWGMTGKSSKKPRWRGMGWCDEWTVSCPVSGSCIQHWNSGKKGNSFSGGEKAQRSLPSNGAHFSLFSPKVKTSSNQRLTQRTRCSLG